MQAILRESELQGLWTALQQSLGIRSSGYKMSI